MPRDIYHQNHGNPVQAHLLPSEPLSLQFGRRNNDVVANRELLRTVMRNLVLVAAICLAGDWLGHAFSMKFPVNVILVFVMAHGMIRLWRAAESYRPNFLLLAVPFIVHFFLPSMVARTMLTAMLAAFVGREFTRHFVQLATGFPMKAKQAAKERQLWETLSLGCDSLLDPACYAEACRVRSDAHDWCCCCRHCSFQSTVSLSDSHASVVIVADLQPRG